MILFKNIKQLAEPMRCIILILAQFAPPFAGNILKCRISHFFALSYKFIRNIQRM